MLLPPSSSSNDGGDSGDRGNQARGRRRRRRQEQGGEGGGCVDLGRPSVSAAVLALSLTSSAPSGGGGGSPRLCAASFVPAPRRPPSLLPGVPSFSPYRSPRSTAPRSRGGGAMLRYYQSSDYLNDLRNVSQIGVGDGDGDGEAASNHATEDYDDDDYAMSFPMPVGGIEIETDEDNDDRIAQIESSVAMEAPSNSADESGIDLGERESVHPNEEPPKPMREGADESMDNTAFDIYEQLDASAAVEGEGQVDEGTAASDNNSGNSGIKSILQNFWGRDAAEKSREEMERTRMWREWLTSGRKYRESSPPPPGRPDVAAGARPDVALDQSLLSVDKGADYVVVAVPAEAANGVGPVLPSFPGGKKFQKKVEKTYRETLANGDVNATSFAVSPTMSTISPTRSIEKKAAKEAKKKKNRKSKTPKEEDMEERRRRRQQKRLKMQKIREPGRISANDWRHNIGNLFNSSILRDVRSPTAWVFVWATLWSAVHRWTSVVAASAATGGIATRRIERARLLARHMCLPTVPHTMMVSAMSLLLVFRTNSAYQRFAEGRRIWNDIVDTTRDFSRMIKLFEFAIGTSKCRRINGLLASFPYLLRHRIRPSLMTFQRVDDPDVERDRENSLLLYPDASLRDTDPDAAALAYDEEETGSSRRKTRELCWVDRRTLPWKLLPGSALGLCARARNRPLWVCDRMAKELAVVEDVPPAFTNRERLALIGYVDKLSRSIGACERIHQTVVPLNYARHALRSLTVWLWTLPFVLVKDLGLLTGPVVAVLAWILFGVYEIGTRIEDPFQGTLRLSIYCDAIRRDVLADAIARDTAFDLDEEGGESYEGDYDYDAIFELGSESGTKEKDKKRGYSLWF